MQSNSLFGSTNAVEVAHPAVPEADSWSDLEKLSREKELIGIYLSAHPLDKYRIALQYGCNTRMKELDNLESLNGRELSMGGIVVGYREGITKTNKSYGVIKVEDYSGVGEFFLIGNDYVNFHKFGVPNLYVFIRGHIEPRFRNSEELAVRINTIELLPDINDRIIESLTVVLPSETIDQAMVDILQEKLITDNTSGTGQTKLFFEVIDEKEPRNPIKLFARPVKLHDVDGIARFLINSEIPFKINNIPYKDEDEKESDESEEKEVVAEPEMDLF